MGGFYANHGIISITIIYKMRFLLQILIFAALTCGGIVYYFWDSPILQQLVPLVTKAKPEETPHIYALRLVERAVKENKPTDQGSMQTYYLQAVESKYYSLVGTEEALSLESFLAGEKTALITVWLRQNDRNNDGRIDSSEWEETFTFISRDTNKDGFIDGDEYWQFISEDIREAFRENDADGSGSLSLAEYIELKGGEEEANNFARSFDLDRNNHISNGELNNAKILYGY